MGKMMIIEEREKEIERIGEENLGEGWIKVR